jgi:hypothetical protein
MTDSEAESLIADLKRLVSMDKNLQLPKQGEKGNYPTESSYKSDKFTVFIYRGSKEMGKITYHAMDNATNTPLLRLDVNAQEHTNPDGEKISGSHLHIFKEGYEIKYAIEFDIENKDLICLTKQFFLDFHVMDLSEVLLQNDLFS